MFHTEGASVICSTRTHTQRDICTSVRAHARNRQADSHPVSTTSNRFGCGAPPRALIYCPRSMQPHDVRPAPRNPGLPLSEREVASKSLPALLSYMSPTLAGPQAAVWVGATHHWHALRPATNQLTADLQRHRDKHACSAHSQVSWGAVRCGGVQGMQHARHGTAVTARGQAVTCLAGGFGWGLPSAVLACAPMLLSPASSSAATLPSLAAAPCLALLLRPSLTSAVTPP